MRPNRLLTNGMVYHVIQKNGCTSIRTLSAHNKHDKDVKPTGEVFTVIRHPCDRLVSAWADRGEDIYSQAKTFEEWLEWVCAQNNDMDTHVAPQYLDLPENIDYLLDFARLEQELGYFGMKIPHYNPSSHKHWVAYFNDDLMNMVGKRYKVDFGLYLMAEIEADIREQGFKEKASAQVH